MKAVGANLEGADLAGADLTCCNLTRSNLEGADLSWTCLDSAHFDGTNLKGVNFAFAHLKYTHFVRADLRGADFSTAAMCNVNLNWATWDETTRWPPGFNPADNQPLPPTYKPWPVKQPPVKHPDGLPFLENIEMESALIRSEHNRPVSKADQQAINADMLAARALLDAITSSFQTIIDAYQTAGLDHPTYQNDVTLLKVCLNEIIPMTQTVITDTLTTFIGQPEDDQPPQQEVTA